eukprot:6211254-Pleurochrysis_carterae.AAC.4
MAGEVAYGIYQTAWSNAWSNAKCAFAINDIGKGRHMTVGVLQKYIPIYWGDSGHLRKLLLNNSLRTTRSARWRHVAGMELQRFGQVLRSLGQHVGLGAECQAKTITVIWMQTFIPKICLGDSSTTSLKRAPHGLRPASAEALSVSTYQQSSRYSTVSARPPSGQNL